MGNIDMQNFDIFYRKAFLIRSVEQKLLSLFADGKLFGTVHTCSGQEFTGVAVANALHKGDFIFSNHRCHGHYIARTDNIDGLIAEIMGKRPGALTMRTQRVLKKLKDELKRRGIDHEGLREVFDRPAEAGC